MADVLGDNIITRLGDTSAANYQAVKSGATALTAYAPGTMHLPFAFVASLMSGDGSAQPPFAQLVVQSARKAIAQAGISVADNERVAFVLSTTKGSNDCLYHHSTDGNVYGLGDFATDIARNLGIKSEPIVVCNACISGLSALILADRLLSVGAYDYVVVSGADLPERFVLSGFHSLSALSSDECRPFDMERCGLNLGSAVATIVLGRGRGAWKLSGGCVRNDAFHISAPSKTAEGLTQCLAQTMQGVDPSAVSFVSAHGTATLFNDQMESMAIQRSGLSSVPMNALKGYFGHTLGAAGVLETIMSMHAADDNTVIGTRGFEERGVSGKVNISSANRPIAATSTPRFVKMLSGFGGCNATIMATRCTESADAHADYAPEIADKPLNYTHCITITPAEVTLDGKQITPVSAKATSLLTALYKQYVADYPKYYKMDGLCRLGFVATELLLKAENKPRMGECSDRAVVVFNHSSSCCSDRKFIDTIASDEDYFPSPAVFVYTLPNIVTGEIAIRNGYHGETSFYILPQSVDMHSTSPVTDNILRATFADRETTSIIAGWLDYVDGEHYFADLRIYERN